MATGEYKFPDEQDDKSEADIEITTSASDVDIEIVDDTPERDRGRRPLDREVADPTDDELSNIVIVVEHLLAVAIKDHAIVMTTLNKTETKARIQVCQENQTHRSSGMKLSS